MVTGGNGAHNHAKQKRKHDVQTLNSLAVLINKTKTPHIRWSRSSTDLVSVGLPRPPDFCRGRKERVQWRLLPSLRDLPYQRLAS